jgi:hypothetical protein
MDTPRCPIRFYHGTHSGLLESISEHGLAPQKDPSSPFRGNLSTIPGFTERHVFLAPAIEQAAFYAREQAAAAGTEPIIFEVRIDDASRLSVTDDYIHMQGILAMLEAAGLPPLEFDDDMDVHQYGKSSDAYYAWREVISAFCQDLLDNKPFDARAVESCTDMNFEDIGHVELAPRIWEAMAARMRRAAYEDQWTASIATDRDPAVAHDGPIPSSHLRLIDAHHTARAISRIWRGEGNPASWDLSYDEARAPTSNGRFTPG